MATPATTPDPYAAILSGIADPRVDDAAATRARAHWLTQQATENATLAGAFVDLSEQRTRIRVTLRDRTEVAGMVAAVGTDVVVMITASGTALVSTRHVTTVRTEGGHASAPHGRDGGPHAEGSRTMIEVLHDLAANRAQVRIRTIDGGDHAGELRAAGVDVLTIGVGSPSTNNVLVHLTAVTLVIVVDPG